MPGLRFGPDITDDAARLQDLSAEARRTLRTSRSERARNAARNRIRAIDETTTRIFGNAKTRNRLARYSTARQGYEAGNRRSRIGGRTAQTGLAQTPLGNQTQIPVRGRYRARPPIPTGDRELARAAARKARPGDAGRILQQVIRQQQAQTRAANRRRSRAGAAGRTRRG